MNLPVMTLQTRKNLFLLKQKVAVLLLAKVRRTRMKNEMDDDQKCQAENGTPKLPDKPIKRWTTIERKPEVGLPFVKGLKLG